MNTLNMSIVEGDIQNKILLENMSVADYYSEINAYFSMKKQQADAIEKATREASNKTRKKN